jgi:hypothetical protein
MTGTGRGRCGRRAVPVVISAAVVSAAVVSAATGRVLAGALLVALAGCGTDPVEADPPPASPPEAQGCAKLYDALPAQLDGHPRRATERKSRQVAAWGDPPIIMRCGVDPPRAYQPTSQLSVVNGVDWLPEKLSNGYLFTTIGRTPGVALAVPADHSPEVDPLVDLSTVVGQTIPAAPDPGEPRPGGLVG